MEKFELSIDHPMLLGAKQSFDACLKEAIRRAIGTGSMEGSANVKISFELYRAEDAETMESFIAPEIKFKAGFTVPTKGNLDGAIVEKSRIVEKDGNWILVNEQIAMDELTEADDGAGNED